MPFFGPPRARVGRLPVGPQKRFPTDHALRSGEATIAIALLIFSDLATARHGSRGISTRDAREFAACCGVDLRVGGEDPAGGGDCGHRQDRDGKERRAGVLSLIWPPTIPTKFPSWCCCPWQMGVGSLCDGCGVPCERGCARGVWPPTAGQTTCRFRGINDSVPWTAENRG